MRIVTIAGMVGMWLATPAQTEVTPLPFEDMAHIICVDHSVAAELLTVYEEDNALGERLLAQLATRGMCERATFSGKPGAIMYKSRRTGKLREGHVFEVEVTSGHVLKGRTRAYMLLYVLHHEA